MPHPLVLAPPSAITPQSNPFDPDDPVAYAVWRRLKLRDRPVDAAALTVDVKDPSALTPGERQSPCWPPSRASTWRSTGRRWTAEDKDLPRRLGAQLGLLRLDANWLADEDGISSIAVGRGARRPRRLHPLHHRAIRWHTDGYYHPPQRRIRGMLLHCVRPAASGGENRLLDPELAYIALRDASPALVRALMQPDAMTIPARAGRRRRGPRGAGRPGVQRRRDGALHMRYTARTRSIEWRRSADVQQAAPQLQARCWTARPGLLRVRLQPGMGLVGHNVLHDRSAFVDDPAHPRLLYRARFLDRVARAV
jgi:hypothetical protein